METLDQIRNRKGFIKLTLDALYSMDLKLLQLLFTKIFVLQTDFNYVNNSVTYYGISKEFEECESGAPVAEYGYKVLIQIEEYKGEKEYFLTFKKW